KRVVLAQVDHGPDHLAVGYLTPIETAVPAGAQGETLGPDIHENPAISLPPSQRFALGKARPHHPSTPASFPPHRHTLTGQDDRPIDPKTRTHLRGCWPFAAQCHAHNPAPMFQRRCGGPVPMRITPPSRAVTAPGSAARTWNEAPRFHSMPSSLV